MEKSEIRYCQDIDMIATDRPIKKTCQWRTPFCANCYNHKLYKVFKGMHDKDVRNENYWWELDSTRLKSDLKRRKLTNNRFRFQTRGETFSNVYDFWKVYEIVKYTPDTEFWIPTRAWRNAELKGLIEKHMFKLSNAHVLASVDPTNTPEEWTELKASGWSTMFYGDNNMIKNPNGDYMRLCSKTFFDEKGACGSCKDGCFSDKRVDVHLKQH